MTEDAVFRAGYDSVRLGDHDAAYFGPFREAWEAGRNLAYKELRPK